MIEVNVDTYVTVEEADEYVGKYYLATDDKNLAWTALTIEQKEVALRNSAMAIDSIIYPGRKKSSDQEMEFPRCYKNGYYFPLNWYETYTKEGGSWHCMVDVPDKVKFAQVEESLELVCRSADSDNYDAVNGAVKSYSTTGLKEEYAVDMVGINGVKNALRSSRARRWVGKYAGGGFDVN